MKDQFEAKNNPRVVVIQKLYSNHLNKDSQIIFPKHKYKKFIKDVVKGTIERKELIQSFIDKEFGNDISENKTELMLKLMIMAAIYEFMYMQKTPVNVVISEYIKVSEFFIDSSKVSYLNAILDKISRKSRITDG